MLTDVKSIAVKSRATSNGFEAGIADSLELELRFILSKPGTMKQMLL